MGRGKGKGPLRPKVECARVGCRKGAMRGRLWCNSHDPVVVDRRGGGVGRAWGNRNAFKHGLYARGWQEGVRRELVGEGFGEFEAEVAVRKLVLKFLWEQGRYGLWGDEWSRVVRFKLRRLRVKRGGLSIFEVSSRMERH